MRVVIVGCGKTKVDHSCPARDMYQSELFRKRRAYAEKSSDAWFILSAKHGLLHPDTVIEPYDETLNDVVIGLWQMQVNAQVEDILRQFPGEFLLFEVHAGKNYVRNLEYALSIAGLSQIDYFQLFVPLAGLGIGSQLAWYNSWPEGRTV